MNSEIIDFKLLLLENYKKLGLNEEELSVLLITELLINQGNDFITADLLSFKMSLDVKIIDQILANLLSKSFLEFKLEDNKTKTSLEPLKNKLLKMFENSVLLEQEKKVSDETRKSLNNIYDSFEKIFSRKLNPLEKQKIDEWLNYGYNEKNIIEAFKETFYKNRKTLRSVEKILISWSSRDDIESEGQSSISSDWNKNLEETIRIAKTPWLDTDDDK